MEQIVLVIHVIAALAVISFVLLSQGKGADVGASFGSGASQTVFGSQGSGNFLSRLTAFAVALFFITSLTLGYFAFHHMKGQSIDELLKKVEEKSKQIEGEMTPIDQSNKEPSKRESTSDIPRLPKN